MADTMRRATRFVGRAKFRPAAKKPKANKLVTLVRGPPVRVVTIGGKNALVYVKGPRVPVKVIGGKPPIKPVRLNSAQKTLLGQYPAEYQKKVLATIRKHPKASIILSDSRMLILDTKSKTQISVPGRETPQSSTGRGGFGHPTTKKTGMGFGQR